DGTVRYLHDLYRRDGAVMAAYARAWHDFSAGDVALAGGENLGEARQFAAQRLGIAGPAAQAQDRECRERGDRGDKDEEGENHDIHACHNEPTVRRLSKRHGAA
ncbi:MAG: hypothetical protein QF767_11750, partial [Alphaproteobacteria bacterium]|nr:hypothetical protein [Alphaproteobacteria bacterium]